MIKSYYNCNGYHRMISFESVNGPYANIQHTHMYETVRIASLTTVILVPSAAGVSQPTLLHFAPFSSQVQYIWSVSSLCGIQEVMSTLQGSSDARIPKEVLSSPNFMNVTWISKYTCTHPCVKKYVLPHVYYSTWTPSGTRALWEKNSN